MHVQAREPVALADEHSLRYEGWRVVAGSAVGVFVSFASLFIYTFGIFLKPLAEEFAWSRQEVSAAFGFAAISVALSSPAIGYLLDRYGPRRIIVPCLTIFGGGFASLSLLTPRLWHLYATFALLGVVGNGTAMLAYSRVVSSWFEQRRGVALGIMMCGGGVGAVVIPPCAQLLMRQYGWRTACLLLGSLPLAIGLPTVIALIRERPARHAESRAQVAGASIVEGLRSRAFWILVAVLFFASIAQNGAIAHMSALLTDRGVSASDSALAISAMGGASLFGRLVTGWLIDRFFAAFVSIGLLAAAATGTFLLSGADSLWMGIASAALIGFGMGGEADITPYLLARYFGLRSFSMLLGFTWTVYACAGAIGPVLMGTAFDATGSYERLLVQLAIGMLGVAALNLLLPRYQSG